jgi:hypothetical protein
MKMEMTSGFKNLTYYGRGPGENYIDRAAGNHVGIYSTSTDLMYEPYLRPQFFGNRKDVRWFALTDNRGDGLLVQAETTIEACASHYDDSDFALEGRAVRHIHEVPKRDGALLNIDMLNAPIGSSANFSSERPPVEQLVSAEGTYTYRYKIKPITGAMLNDLVRYTGTIPKD